MSLYIRVVNGEVQDVWDTVPDTRPGWRNAVEIKPEIISTRQKYTGHTFNIDIEPVQIIHGVEDIQVDDRKNSMIREASMAFNMLLQRMANDPDTYDADALQIAKDSVAPRHAAIDACATHDDLDALM